MKVFSYLNHVQANFTGREDSVVSLPENLLLPKQVHGDDILVVESLDQIDVLASREADAVMTDVSGVALGVKTADCVPILLAHPQGGVAAVHAGWRGSEKQILRKTLVSMQQRWDLDLSQMHMAVGPAICGDCYEVGEEVVKAFPKEIYDHEPMIEPNGEKFLLDLVEVNVQQALAAGVVGKNINIDSRCTYECADFYSYRRAQKTGAPNSGRNISWIAIK